MKNKIIYIAILAIFSFNGFSQTITKEQKGKKEYDKYAYIDAIKTYERLYEKGYKSPDMLLKLGNSYYFNADLEKAVKYYDELYATSPDQEAEYFYRYSQSLRATKDYKKADEMMAIFNSKSGNDLRAKLYNQNRDYLAEIKKNSGRYKLENAGINSKYSDYGPTFMGEKVVFCSARDTGNFSKRIHTWTGEYFTNLYSANLAEDGSLGEVEKFGNKLNSKYHEDTPVFSKDGKTVYFTRNNYLDKRGYDASKVTLLKIYKATVDEKGKWVNITPLPFNSDSYQTAHPALSPDGKTMYFASDMPGSFGKSDIYKVAISDDGSFGNPVNLGNTINTEGRETYPFVNGKNELYFASDGHPGLGGLDIFGAKIPEDGIFTKILNVGEEANSPKDDFAYIINSETKRGFLSSNRDGGEGSDDIYKFIETRELFIEQAIFGVVTDTNTDEVLADAKITLLDEKFNKIAETTTDAKGFYEFLKLEPNTKFYIKAEKEGYNTKENPVITGKEEGRTELNIDLEKTAKPIPVGGDLADVFGINLIYFDLDKWNIRPDAAVDLAKILDVLEQYPTMKIDIRSHTDSRASHAYNERLSDRRAKSTMAWLVSKGISKDRLTAKGYGETQLINKCSDGVPCTEAEHQLNRRSQFIITEL
ncbi:OmpA family protein [Flavobacterium capsici]|uniref:OmpA family protein n=1 Tax=Flavobacterium capsici TaxID=3075618 RepID=A0AA96EZB7_9FLAO|nr:MULTISPECIES: OmpA family protein [unclassified Flavobacterium]WNM18416.1 OmpA family protein [Flavobacterium sp. PMR2A8]WNM22467.1 OmpA family protein [Flavobacterium sp. PMTSA4]